MNNQLRFLQNEMNNIQARMVKMTAGLPQHAQNPSTVLLLEEDLIPIPSASMPDDYSENET